MKSNTISNSAKICFLQIRHDIIQGFLRNKRKYLILTFFLLITYISFQNEMLNLSAAGFIQGKPGLLDFIMYIAQGMREYIPESEEPFVIPFAWLSINLLLAYIIGDYATRDLYEFGTQMILRARKKKYWLAGKIIYCFVCTLTVYFFQVVVAYLFSALNGNYNIFVSEQIWKIYFGIDPCSFSRFEIVNLIFLLPFLTSFVLSLMQLLGTLIFKPIYSFLIVTIYLISSAYWKSYYFIGNYSMFLRNDQLCTNGLDATICLTILLVLCPVLVVLIGFVFKKRDIIEKN